MRREPENHLKQMLNLEVPGRRPRGRPKGRWRDGITRDMKQLHIEAEDAEDRSFWRKRTQAADLNLGTGASRLSGHNQAGSNSKPRQMKACRFHGTSLQL
ncbi:hypothetical protein PoB_005251500 [Plakobranchus ocellatus]|uniref:Uncharacterized protein n=1 Tax=Plakobranchus ocellatus TaxID=259542 RepID=A0AAV4C3P4_9GAST|nr:hypothetical protein PoB_005251500 [Plakobranchus ocellatus]